jgi:hypothetical protein
MALIDQPAQRRRRWHERGSLPSTAELLTAGGDTRLALDPLTDANRYGCPSRPMPDVAAFGSATASIISEAGFAAADQLRRRVLRSIEEEPAAVACARELQRLRRELVRLNGLDDLPGVEIVFAASGTDLHLIAGKLALQGRAPLAVMVEPSETGSGVPAALAGRHFSSRAPLGRQLTAGEPVAEATAEVAAIASREPDGTPRLASSVDAEAAALVEAAADSGRSVLLTVVDVSKTGLIAPRPETALALSRRWPDRVTVLIDACQFRLAPETLRAYLGAGAMVALTGSKFVTGPAFSGALLMPRGLADRLRRRPLPDALGAFSARAEWPSGWDAAAGLPAAANLGLLLRWEAALAELRAFRALPEAFVAGFLARFAAAIAGRLESDPIFAPLPTPAPARGAFGSGTSWDRIPTIFPFLVHHSGPRMRPALMNREETAQLYRALQTHAPLRCQLGQPVQCGARDGLPVSALRLCAGARLVVEAAAAGADRVIDRALRVLDETAVLARLLSRSGAPAVSSPRAVSLAR